MRYTLIPYSNVDPAAYADLLDVCGTATPFHALEWMPIYKLFSPQAHQFLVCAEDNGVLFAAMPVTVFEKLFLRAVFSSGFGLHGGPTSRPDCPPEVVTELMRTFVHQFRNPRNVLISVQDFHGLGASVQQCGFSVKHLSTHLLALPSRYEDLGAKARAEARYGFRRTAKAGIVITRSKEPVDFEQWQELCSANYVRHGRRPYPRALYRAVAQRIQETDSLRFYVAKLGDRVVGGSVHVFALKQAYYWMGATAQDFRSYGVNDGLFQVVFQDAIAAGAKVFDFGPSPEGAASLIRFKQKWGSVQADYLQSLSQSTLGRIGANLVRYRRF